MMRPIMRHVDFLIAKRLQKAFDTTLLHPKREQEDKKPQPSSSSASLRETHQIPTYRALLAFPARGKAVESIPL